jgi:hypothetical protein
MTDLINRVNSLHVDVVNTLLKKYQPVLEEIKFKSQEDIPYMAYVLNLTVNYVNQKHKEETSDWKTWCGVLIKRLFEREIVKTKEDIFKHIDQFLEYKKKEYKKYVENIALYSDEYHRDNPFIEQYIKQLSL